MRSRSDRVFESCDPDLDTIVLLNGNGELKDKTFQYVTGVTRGGYERCGVVLKRGQRPQMFVSTLEEESARTAPDADTHAFATPAARDEVVRTLLAGSKKIGVNAAAIVLANVRLLEKIVSDLELVDVGKAIETARLVKDEVEVERVRAACKLTSDVAAEIPSMLREGMTELDLAADIATAIQKRGAKVAFDTIVCFGANGAEPHYSPGPVPLKKGDMILIDFGSELNDYCSDITRMYLFGEASAEQRAMFDVVRSAQISALEATTAGALGKTVHEKAAEVIDASEFAGRFIHGTGHSIGLEVHDGPGLSSASELTLAPGMIMTVEPGVYVPGVGGVRIEDTVLVTDNGPEILTPVTKDLVEVPV